MEDSSPMADPAVATAPLAPLPRLFNRDFLLLWQAQAISQLGDQAFSLAMALWVAEKTGSATLMGLLLTAGTLPAVILGPVGGVVADRRSRMRILIVCDVLGGVTMLAVSSLMFHGQLATRTIVGLLFVAAVVLGVVRGFFGPALAAVIPDLVPAERLAGANSLSQLSQQAALLLGQGVGGILYRWLGAPVLFLADGLSYLFAAASESLVQPPAAHRPREGGVAGKGGMAAFREEMRVGFRFLVGKPGLLPFVLAASSFNFFTMPVFVLLPFFVSARLRVGPEWYGFLLAALSVGSIVGFLLAGSLKLVGAARGRSMSTMMLLAPLPYLVGFARSAPVALAVTAALGVTLGLVNVNFYTIVQTATPAELRGRVLGFINTLAGALMPLGLAVGGIVGDWTGKNVPLVYTACAVSAFTINAIALGRRDTRAFLTGG